MHRHGNIALGNFLLAFTVHQILASAVSQPLQVTLFIPLGLFIAAYLVSYKVVSAEIHEVAWRAQFLGFVFSCGTCLVFSTATSVSQFGWYMIVMSLFHFSEYYVTSIIRPDSLNLDSFLLNHSKAYGVAAAASWIEFYLELWISPGLKETAWITYIGLAFCFAGEVVRKLAMLTAGSNFDHLVRMTREKNHQLVTSGIYGLVRHPSYVGWFYWSIGTQLVLCNPVCFLAYFYASWKFFEERVFQEEITLINFFGAAYIEYQQNVPTGLPFIKGYE